MKKRITAMLLIAALVFVSTACGNITQEPDKSKQKAETQEQTSQEDKQATTQAQPTQEPTAQPTSEPVIEVDVTLQEDDVETDAQHSDILIPDIGIKQESIPDTEAFRFVRDMKAGWNLGNTLDAHIQGKVFEDEMLTETCWGNPVTTKEMIDAVKAAGYNTLRLPVSWHDHVTMEPTAASHMGAGITVSFAWMDRVQEVVDYAYANDMYVILNIHHDTNPDYYYPDSGHYDQSANYICAVWSAIAGRFGDYDHHLIFESINEPRLVGTGVEWSFNENDGLCQDSADCINRLNQLFVDTVRAGGGNNKDRYLMIPGYGASPAGEVTDLFVLPTDTAENRIIVSTHAYTPYNFALKPVDEGEAGSFNLDSGYTKEIDILMTKLYDKFVANGIPVVMGEYGAVNRNDNLQDRVNFYVYYVAAARARGITCCVWDNGYFSGQGELFGLLNRNTLTWEYPIINRAIMKYL